MMNSALIWVLPPVTVLVLLFLVLRLRFFAEHNIPGRWPFVFGGLLVVAATVWQGVKASAAYHDWFIDSAYFWLDFSQVILLVLGSLLLAAGLSLYSDHWQTRGEQIDLRDRRLSVMENLQRAAREPYQLMQLLDIALKEILSELPESSGALFLLNRARRQLVLTASANLTAEETTLLEHYPLGRNLVSRTVESGEPSLGGDFELFDRDGRATASRFRSVLMLPLVSSSERIGLVLLLAESRQTYTPAEVRYLSPAIEWLAEKIKSARLSRELNSARSEVGHFQTEQQEFLSRLNAAGQAFASADTVEAFCRSLVGLHAAQSVHLVGLSGGALQFHGGSEPAIDLTENYRTALIEALDREKPLIINQEATGDSDRTYIAHSTLLYPVDDHGRRDALLFRREGGPFKVSENDLRTIRLFARLARAVLKQNSLATVDITRRKGFNKILALLRFQPDSGDTGAEYLVKQLKDLLPNNSSTLALSKQPNGSFAGEPNTDGFDLMPGEGIVAEAVGRGEAVFVRGRGGVVKRLEEFQPTNREAFYRLLGENRVPSFMAAFPLTGRSPGAAVILVFIPDCSEGEQGEWERLLTLAVELYSLRLEMAELRRRQATPTEVDSAPSMGGIVNRLNNHLSALIGNAELGMGRDDLPGEVRRQFESIIVEAESAARFVRGSLARGSETTPAAPPTEAGAEDIGELVTTFLDRVRISDNLYMVGGRPREVYSRCYPVAPIKCPASAVSAACAGAVGKLAALAGEDEVITIACYRLEGHVYLDLSRHGRDLPAVEQIARFGDYAEAAELVERLADARFLSPVVGRACLCSLDRRAAAPSYISFKFPLSQTPVASDRRPGRVRLLAIDDQTVILDLITAMAQSLDYDIMTAQSGAEGLKLAEQHSFDIVLADLAMPGASGLEVARRLGEISPGVPVVLVTGWEVNIEPEQLRSSGIVSVLHKPFRIEQLTELVRRATAGRTVG